jgi:ferritin-like metal-binding protein YciE
VTDSALGLFEHELKDIYDAELRLVDALAEMSKAAPDEKLSRSFDEHRAQTERQSKRLEEVFRTLGKQPEREECEGVQGLITEVKEFIDEEDAPDPILNVFLATAATKVEHYEVDAYQSLLKLAGKAGIDDILPPLRENLAEEQATAKANEGMADTFIAAL